MLEKSVGQDGPAERKLSTGKLDPFYHFNTHPDTGAKTNHYRGEPRLHSRALRNGQKASRRTPLCVALEYTTDVQIHTIRLCLLDFCCQLSSGGDTMSSAHIAGVVLRLSPCYRRLG